MKPIVSVIIPTYNRALFIEECLNSVLNQTYRPIELLVVDDGSTDDTERITQEFKKNKETSDFQVILLRQKNKGAPAARNKGIKNASGSFIQFLDSDDLLKPEKIEVEQSFLSKNKNVDLVYSIAQYLNQNNELLNKFWGQQLTSSSLDYFNNSWQTMCSLYRATTIKKIGWWHEELCINQDWEYCIRAIAACNQIHFLPKVHSLFRVHDSGNIGSNLNLEKIKGKEKATTNIYHLLQNENKLDEVLKNKFRKRYIFCFCNYVQLKAKEESIKLFYFLDNQKIISKWLMLILRIRPVSMIILKIHKIKNSS